MSAPSPAQGRPTVVTAAGYLLFGVALLAVVNALLPLPYVSHASTVAHQAYSKIQNGDTVASAYSAITYTVSFVYLLAAVGFSLLGRFNLRGNRGTRIATFVIGGIGVLCCGASLGIGRLASGIGQSNNSGNSAEMRAAAKQVAAAYPSWLTGVQTTLAVLALLAMIGVLILLALPASNEYYRAGGAALPEPGLPPLPYPTVGGVPAAPPAQPTVPPTPPAQPPAPPAQDE